VPSAYAADGGYIFDDVDVKLFSIGGEPGGSIQRMGARAGSDLSVEWLAFEGSADYQRTDFGDTRVHTYPVQVSAWLYLLPGKTAEPVYSRRRLVLHDGKGRGFDDTQNDSVDMLGRSPFSAFILLQWPMQIVWYLVIGLLCVTLPLSAAALTTSDSTKHLYDRVMEEFQHRDYDAALAGFRLFMELHGDSPLASSAQYWIGECEFRLGRFQEAVGSFEQVMARYPRSPKVPSATLKKAMAYDKLRMKNEARILFERVIVQFPHSTEAEAAKKALRE